MHLRKIHSLPERYLLYICPQCGAGTAVPASSVEAAIWEMTGSSKTEPCRYCKGVNMVVQEVIFRKQGLIQS